MASASLRVVLALGFVRLWTVAGVLWPRPPRVLPEAKTGSEEVSRQKARKAKEKMKWTLWGWVRKPKPQFVNYGLIHIPKVAGVSWGLDIADILEGHDAGGVYSMEQCYDEVKEEAELAGNTRITTLVRDPRAHVVAEWTECAGNDDDWQPPVPEPMKANFSTWIANFNETNSKAFGCYHPQDMQTRHLASGTTSCHVGVSEEQYKTLLKSALNTLDKMFFVGVLEQYQASICVFQGLAFPHYDLPPYCNCENQSAWASWEQIGHHEDHGISQFSLSDLSTAQLKAVDRLTQLDVKLYEAVNKRFQSQAKAVEKQHGVKLLC